MDDRNSSNSNMDDQHIIARINNGVTRHFKSLFNRYQDRIYSLCRYMLENPQDAEDAAQDTFIKAYQGLKSYSHSASFYTWMSSQQSSRR